MTTLTRTTIGLGLLGAILALPVLAQDGMGMGGGHSVMSADDIKWMPGPPSIPKGAFAAVMDGDPTKAGIFTMRLRVPAGYKVPPHYHPADERVTVLQGTFLMGFGEKFDESKMTKINPGGFSRMDKGVRHYAMAGNTETVVQLTGMGPWEIIYLDPKDDPRQAAK